MRLRLGAVQPEQIGEGRGKPQPAPAIYNAESDAGWPIHWAGE